MMEVNQRDDHAGQRQIGGHRQIDTFGQQNHHLPERQDDQNRGIVKHLQQVSGTDKLRRAHADAQHHQHYHHRQQQLAVFQQVSDHAASSPAPLAALTIISALASPALNSATISPSCITMMRSAMPMTSGNSEDTIITASPRPTSSDIN